MVIFYGGQILKDGSSIIIEFMPIWQVGISYIKNVTTITTLRVRDMWKDWALKKILPEYIENGILKIRETIDDQSDIS